MAKTKAPKKMPVPRPKQRVSQARIELPVDEMDRVRKAARLLGLSLSAFLRMAVLRVTVETEKTMKP